MISLDKDKKKRMVLLLLGLVVLTLVLIFTAKERKEYALEKAAQEGTRMLESTANETEADFQMQVYVSPQFEKGDAEGELMLMNPAENAYKTKVKICLEEDGREVYQSKVLNPGERIRYDVLSEQLEKGIYPATAYFDILDLETEEVLGQTAATIEITVQN